MPGGHSAISKFFFTLGLHNHRHLPHGEKALLRYQARVRFEWHVQLKKPGPTWNIGIINETRLDEYYRQVINEAQLRLALHSLHPPPFLSRLPFSSRCATFSPLSPAPSGSTFCISMRRTTLLPPFLCRLAPPLSPILYLSPFAAPPFLCSPFAAHRAVWLCHPPPPPLAAPHTFLHRHPLCLRHTSFFPLRAPGRPSSTFVVPSAIFRVLRTYSHASPIYTASMHAAREALGSVSSIRALRGRGDSSHLT